MPYIGQDGRSPGEIWVKTSDGWRTCRTIRILNNNMNRQLDSHQGSSSGSNQDDTDDVGNKNTGFLWKTKAPYIVLPGYSNRGPLFYFVSKRGTKQNDHYSTVGEAFQALEFRRAAGDPRKFLYVCRLLEVLIKNDHLTPECGMARKQLKLTLEEIVLTVLDTECSIHLAKQLVHLAKEQLIKERHLYLSFQMSFEKRQQELTDLQGKLKKFKIKKLRKGITRHSCNITELPDECLRMIFRCFTDHRDICCLAKVNRKFNKLCSEQTLWRDLCRFHFTSSQLERIDSNLSPDWKSSYRKYIRRSSMRELFADILELCSHCHCMFWKRSSHPCTYDPGNKEHDKPPVFIPITPQGFLHLFEA